MKIDILTAAVLAMSMIEPSTHGVHAVQVDDAPQELAQIEGLAELSTDTEAQQLAQLDECVTKCAYSFYRVPMLSNNAHFKWR